MRFSQDSWPYVRSLAAPGLLLILCAVVVVQPMRSWLEGEARFDEAAIREWIEEARVFKDTLPEMARAYLQQLEKSPADDPAQDIELLLRAEAMQEHLRSLGNPPTKLYPQLLPLFPIIYRLEVAFELPGKPTSRIEWDSELPRHPSQYRELAQKLDEHITLRVHYQLHAYNKRQSNEQATALRFRWVVLLAFAGTILALLWIYLVQQRERERIRQRVLAQEKLTEAEHRRLEEELRRRDAEQRQEEIERKLLEQRIATQAAEGQALELKSQLYASIGIMAASYAHNIKNLLVRPNDLLHRCLEMPEVQPTQQLMLKEVRETLGTVTDRLQQILRTVRRDPSRAQLARLDLNAVVSDLQKTWAELGREKWKLALAVEAPKEPLWIDADLSHLQQSIENLLFNARDATFEMRNHLRDLAHKNGRLSHDERRQALIAAAAWKGRVVFRTHKTADGIILEVEDNGIGMSEEVRRRCTETHFSTKRDNAIHEGNSTGMGLGLSFVTVVLEHHRARLDIISTPMQGTTFRIVFPLVCEKTS